MVTILTLVSARSELNQSHHILVHMPLERCHQLTGELEDLVPRLQYPCLVIVEVLTENKIENLCEKSAFVNHGDSTLVNTVKQIDRYNAGTDKQKGTNVQTGQKNGQRIKKR